MKKIIHYPLLICVLLLATGGACSPPDEDIDATVNAAIAATQTSEAEFSTAVGEAVEATVQAVELMPTPVVDVTDKSEEELAQEIDEAVDEAATESEEAAAAATEAAADDVITDEEIKELEELFLEAEEALLLAEALSNAYYQVYGDYAYDALELLIEMEDDLEVIADTLLTTLTLLEQGAEAVTTTVGQLEALADALDVNAAEVQTSAQEWITTLQTVREGRVAEVLSVLPTEIATDRLGALQSAREYAQTVRDGLADGVILQEELAAIAQAGANASGSLSAQGGQLQNLADSVTGLTTQIARGDLPQAQLSLGAFEAALPGR